MLEYMLAQLCFITYEGKNKSIAPQIFHVAIEILSNLHNFNIIKYAGVC